MTHKDTIWPRSVTCLIPLSPCSLHSSLAIPGPHPAGFHHLDFALAIPFAWNVFPTDTYMANSLTSFKVFAQ